MHYLILTGLTIIYFFVSFLMVQLAVGRNGKLKRKKREDANSENKGLFRN